MYVVLFDEFMCNTKKIFIQQNGTNKTSQDI